MFHANRRDAGSPSISRHGSEWHLVGPLWHGSGTCSARKYRPGIRMVLYRSHWLRRSRAPIAYGTIADHSSRMIGILASACTALVILPLVISLRTVFSSSAH
jgi:hypothetical protein